MNPKSLLVLSLLLSACGEEPADTAGNQPPVAQITARSQQSAEELYALAGVASYDPEGAPLTWHWTLDYAPEASLLPDREAPFAPNHDGSGRTAFQPDAVGTYVISLRVHDGLQYSEPAYTVLEATAPEGLPVADAGRDQLVGLGERVTVSGLQSFDPLGENLSYRWELAVVPSGTALGEGDLAGAGTAEASFTPDLPGTWVLSLVVSNALSSSLPDAVRIEVEGESLPPMAWAGDDLVGEDCTAIPLDGSGSSDPDGDPLTAWWTLQSQPPGSDSATVEDPEALQTSLWPDVAGRYTLSLSVFDGVWWSEPDLVMLDLAERVGNEAPVVDAGPQVTVEAGEAGCVRVSDGWSTSWSCSECAPHAFELGAGAVITDADGDPLSLTWSTADARATVLEPHLLHGRASVSKLRPTKPGLCTTGAFTFTLAAQDCPGATASDTTSVQVRCCGVEE
ncbi:MAG: PKD domain-containing protein [Deltaproteobacteria bacterium]|nr:PKD domain-containing protein [Deltaproteobacteria bacterium]